MFHITITILLRNLQHEAESYNKTFQEMGNILSPSLDTDYACVTLL